MSAEPSPLIRDLLRPRALGLDDGIPTELRTTHASWVILAGADVFKIKRPVDLGFLDYRTAEARRHFCEEEVRLNRRLAPDVYRGVRAVVATPDGHALDSGGPAVDWAVHMRRLPDDRSALALLGAGRLDAAMLERLAAHLAAFLGAAERRPAAASPEALRRIVDENFDQAAPFVGELLDAATLGETRAFQIGALTDGAARFAARVAEGRVREGHGDLRLEHVYFLDDDGRAPPVIIDCIEFSASLRCNDAAGEVAFLAMELAAAEKGGLAAGFLARFAEAADDCGLYAVIDFYLSLRAWVRGKVAAFVAADADTPAQMRRRKRDEARADFLLARSFAGGARARPFLVAVGGVIGSGKSTLAAGLGRALAAPVISSDRTRKHLAGLSPTTRADAVLYTDEARDRVYVEIIRRAGLVLDSGRGVILDATFAARRWRQGAAAAARAAGATFIFIEARVADEDRLRARLAARRHGATESDATDEQLAASRAAFQPVAPDEADRHLIVDMSGPVDSALQDLVQEMSGLLQGRPPDKDGISSHGDRAKGY